MGRFSRFAQTRHDELRSGFRRQLQQGLRRLIPGVQRQTERTPVHRQERTAAQQRVRLERIFRSQVNVALCRMKGADLDHDQIERPEARANFSILGREPGIAAEEYGVTR